MGLWTLKVFEQRVGIGDFRYRSGWVGYGSYGEAKKEGNNFKRHGNRLGTWSSLTFFKRCVIGIQPGCLLQLACLCVTLRLDWAFGIRRSLYVIGGKWWSVNVKKKWCPESEEKGRTKRHEKIEKPRDGIGSMPTGFLFWCGVLWSGSFNLKSFVFPRYKPILHLPLASLQIINKVSYYPWVSCFCCLCCCSWGRVCISPLD